MMGVQLRLWAMAPIPALPSCPDLVRASTSLRHRSKEVVDGGTGPAMTEVFANAKDGPLLI
jgi:hypothetical protein